MQTQTDRHGHKKSWGVNESLGIDRSNTLGNTNTPQYLANNIVSNFIAPFLDTSSNGRWLEPAVGGGAFAIAILKHIEASGKDPLEFAKRFDCIDIDPVSIEIFKNRLNEEFGWSEQTIASLPVYNCDIFDFKPPYLFEGIVTNPPYVAFKNWGKTTEERKALLEKRKSCVPGVSKGADLYIYFFEKCHQLLDDNGFSLFLCSDGWIDAGYGESLRKSLTEPNSPFNLDVIAAWPWDSFFRDDTSPIITIVRRNKGDTTRIITDDGYISDFGNKTENNRVHDVSISREELSQWFCTKKGISSRQRLITPANITTIARSHLPLEKTISIGEIFDVIQIPWSFNEIQKSCTVTERPLGSPLPEGHVAIFFNKQGRVGKPADYSQAKRSYQLPFSVEIDTDMPKGKKPFDVSECLMLNQAVDRLPLIFFRAADDDDGEWIGCSKYLVLRPKNKLSRNDLSLFAAAITSSVSLLTMELQAKEGTRKTLRVGENGFVKELKKDFVEQWKIPNPLSLSKEKTSIVLQLQNRLSAINFGRIESVISNDDWVAMDSILSGTEFTRSAAYILYLRRMRNTSLYQKYESFFTKHGRW